MELTCKMKNNQQFALNYKKKVDKNLIFKKQKPKKFK